MIASFSVLVSWWLLLSASNADDIIKANGGGSGSVTSMSECPQPKELPTILFVADNAGLMKPRLKIQRNFNKVTFWSWTSGSGIGPIASNLINLGTVENVRRNDHAEDDAAGYSSDFELDETIQLKVGWHAACGGYDYVVDGTRVTCSLCSLFKLCYDKAAHQQHQPSSTGNETDMPVSHGVNGHRHLHHHHAGHHMKTCAENVVALFPDLEYTRTSMLATFAVGDIPLSEAKLSIKVTQPNLCLPDKRIIFDMEYQIFANTFVVVNVTGLELGKIYALTYQPVGHFRFGTSQRVHFRPILKHFRMPTMSALCSVEGGEEILANQLWPTDNSNRLNPHRPLERLF